MRFSPTLLGAALAVALNASAHAELVNPFVSAAQSPGVGSIPAPPLPPGLKSDMIRPPGGSHSVNPSSLVFEGTRTPSPPAAPQLPQPAHEHPPTSDLSKAVPGQTLSAPGLPNIPKMPPIPEIPPGAIANIGGSPYFGGNTPPINQAALMEQTHAVNSTRFTAETGKTYRLVMSSVTPNLMISPFSHPKLITTSANAVRFVAHGNSLVITVAPGEAVGAYVTGENPSDPLIALVFEPKPLPPQNYELSVDNFIQKKHADQDAEAKKNLVQGSSTQYTQRAVSLIEKTISGTIPDGFGPVARRHWPLGRNQQGLVVEPVEVLSSGEEVIDVLSVTNTTASAITLEENDFYRRGVEAVALSAHTPLMPGQSLQVTILRRASESDASDTLMSVSRP